MTVYWWNPYFLWILAAAAVLVLISVLMLRVWRRRRILRRQLTALSRLLQLENPVIKPYPVLTLAGRYYSYDVAIEMKVNLSRVHIELQHPIDGRLFIQSEAKPALIARLYGMEIIITGHAVFDHSVMVCATDETRTQQLFTPYMIERFLRAQLPPFHMDFQKGQAYAEISLSADMHMVKLAHLIANMVEIAEFLYQGRHTLPRFDPPLAA